MVPQYLQNYITISFPSSHINSSKSTQFDLAWITYEFMDKSLSTRMGALIGQFKDYILTSMERKVGFLIDILTRVILNKEMAAALTFNRFYAQLNPAEIEMIIQKAKELQHEMDNDFPFKNIMVKSILSEIVAFMMRKCPPKSISNLSSPIHQLIAYINEHFAEDINLSDLATKFSFSPNYLGQLLKNNLGYTFHEYINLLRLKYACNLLITSDVPLKEIASLAGYRSVEYFLYVFKSKLNMTPQQYRKQADII